MTGVKYESVPIEEIHHPLVDLSTYDFILEPSYYNQGLSSTKKMYLRKSVADKLSAIQKELKIYKFKIWDGYRPREVQNAIYQKFWNELREEHPEWDEEMLKAKVEIFVTDAKNPQRIPPHATGGAVDLTLVDEDGKELDMGTGFDHFGPEAAALYFEENNRSELVKNNRRILREAMASQEFRYDTDEWWHFDYGNQIWAAYYNKPLAIFGEIMKETVL